MLASRIAHLSLPLLAAAAVAGPTVAHAAPPSGLTHTPARFIDEADLVVNLLSQGGGPKENGYAFVVKSHVFGVNNDADGVKVEWTQGGKVLATQRCKFDAIDGDEALINCRYEPKDGKYLTASGKITANLLYADDQDGKDYLLRKLELQVGTYYWQKKKSYQLVGDDLLGAAIAWQEKATAERPTLAPVHFYFWMAGWKSLSSKLRCSIDGTKLGKDLDFELQENETIEKEDDSTGNVLRYKWSHINGYPGYALVWGKRADLEAANHGKLGDQITVLGDHPGAWECEVRQEGASVRTFRFKVDDSGRIVPPPAQAALEGARLISSEALVEVDLPKTPFDQRVRPDAIRASMPFGLPWPKDPAIQAHLKTLPAASGFANPGSGSHK